MRDALNLLGLCMRSGRLKSGLDECEQAVKRQGARLCLVDAGASDGSMKVVQDACAFAHVPMLVLPRGELGHAIGKPGRVAAAVMDEGFARRIGQLLQAERGV